MRVIAVSDSRGAVYQPEGLDLEALERHKAATGSVARFPGAAPIGNADLLALDVTVLCLAAIECALTSANAPKVKARIVAEAANGPTAPDADRILHSQGAFLIPDLLCNAGSVIISYFEWAQNMSGYSWDLGTVHQRLEAKVADAFARLVALRDNAQVHTRSAAYCLAVERVAEACRLRGWV
jgi:glutamate dehydrogenase (NAD(P)+)